jgi:hypothetical protein
MSSTLEVNVKWGKESVVINFTPDQGVKALKAELEEKTGVPAERMKIMPKSKGTIEHIEHTDLISAIKSSTGL